MPLRSADGFAQLFEWSTMLSKLAEPGLKELLMLLARQPVYNPDAVAVKETKGDTASVLELRVAKEDLGRVIGK